VVTLARWVVCVCVVGPRGCCFSAELWAILVCCLLPVLDIIRRSDTDFLVGDETWYDGSIEAS
jgi:hypothetical protein